MASKQNTISSDFVTKAEAAQILGLPDEKGVTHVEGTVNGKSLCLKQVPGLYVRAHAEAIRKARDEKAAQKAQEKAERDAEKAKREPVQAHPGNANQVREALQKAVDEVAAS